MTYLPLPALGQATSANSLPVVVSSDQSTLNISVKGSTTGTPTETTTSISTATSTTLVAANASRKYLLIQNSSASNIMISLAAATLTGITPTSSNKGIVLAPGAVYESPPHYCTTAAITVYQTSGATINTVYAVEG